MIQYAAPFMALADVTEYWVPLSRGMTTDR
jgi:hypothetical protein